MGTTRIGIIGSGMMGAEHLMNLSLIPEFEVSAIAEPDPGSRELGTALAPEAILFDSTAELVAAEAADAVIVCTPNHTHADVVEELAGSGIHVLLEKPMGHTLDACDRIAAVAEDHGGIIQVGMEYRWMAPIARLIDDVHTGEIGAVKMVSIREHRFPFLPKVGDWNRFNRNTGGTLVEKCCHFFDLMTHIVKSEPVRVMASGGQDVNHLDERYDGEQPDILDNAFVIVDYADGSRTMLDLCMFADRERQNEHVTAVGERGRLEAFVPSSEYRRTPAEGERTSETIEVPAEILAAGYHHGSTYYELRSFLGAIRGEHAPEVTVADGRRAVMIGVAAHLSIDEGRVVEIGELA